MKIGVLGAGWYGAHVAMQLQADGHEVSIMDKANCFFSEASGKNQFRLHLGLHYARSSMTRHQSRDGYFRFIERYPKFSKPVCNNLYIIPRRESLIDFKTYYSIMMSSGINLSEVNIGDYIYLNGCLIEGVVRCDERVILTSAAKTYFESRLSGNFLKYDQIEVDIKSLNVNGVRYDHLIDATWGSLFDTKEGYFFEGTILFYCRIKIGITGFPAITLVDGNLWSLYPTDDISIFTLSHVLHTPIYRSKSKKDVFENIKMMTKKNVFDIQNKMVLEVEKLFPEFKEYFDFIGEQFSVKMKPVDCSDQRACTIDVRDGITEIISGKIDNIFYASDHICGQFESFL